MIEFHPVTTEDTPFYLQYLQACPQVPADCYSAFIYGYDAVWPTVRGYSAGLCWQTMDIVGRRVWYPPMGDWTAADWQQIFNREIPRGTLFRYVPKTLKDLWVLTFKDRFTVRPCPDDWDYIYSLDTFSRGTDSQRRLCRRFREDYSYAVEPLTSDLMNEVRRLNAEAETFIRAGGVQNCTELDNDDRAMDHIMDHWDGLPTIEGILMRVAGRPVSYAMWDAIDDRICVLFNKNLYEYRGVSETVTDELCRINQQKGRLWLNYTCDAGIEGLRRAKQERHPFCMLEKYEMIWN